MQQQVREMRERYGEAKDLLQTFTPELQTLMAQRWHQAYMGYAPSLNCAAAGYGKPTALLLICMQLEDVNLFSGVKEKMSVSRQKKLAELILTEYGHLKITELILFFYRLKLGQYGRFFGAVDALFISSSLLEFMNQRRHDRAQIDEWKMRNTKQQHTTDRGVTYEEYLRWKSEKEKHANQPIHGEIQANDKN